MATGTGFARSRESGFLQGFDAMLRGVPGAVETATSASEHWQVNAHGTLIWDGQPYLPVGVRISGDPESIKAARAAGIQDAIVELPASGAGWAEALDALEKANMRYLVAINSLAPMAKGVAIDPAGYRIDGITDKQHIDLTLPGATSVMTVLATKRDGSVESTKQVPTPDGHFSMDIEPLNELEHVLLLYPVQTSLEQPDFWDELDSHRDTLIAAFKHNPPGKGLRGIVNPLGSLLRLPNKQLRFVPSSPYFRMELASYLQNKYSSVETALRGWAMNSSDVDSFERMARLVPLWAGARGISQLWDPTTSKFYLCDSKTSLVWRDLQDVVDSAADRRFRRLVASVRETVDVPIVQDFSGWSAAYEGSTPSVDGVGVHIDSSSPAALWDEASRGESAILRWSKPGWCVATRIDLGPEGTSLGSTLDDLSSIGTRGWFVRVDTPAGFKAVAAEAARSGNVGLAQDSVSPLYFPEAAMNPANVQRLPGGYWWLPSPAAGNRIDLGSRYSAYRILDRSGNLFALWANGSSRREKLRLAEPKLLRIKTLDGSDPKAKVTKNGVELTLSEFPVFLSGVEEIPVPESALNETVAQFDQLSKLADSTQKDLADDIYFFKDSLTGFDRNPGGSFATLRSVLRHMAQRLAPYVWIEGESSSNNNFSEPMATSGCSNGGVLALHTALSDRHYFAEYEVPVRSQATQQVWIAARMPAGARSHIRAIVAGQALQPTGGPIGAYGLGFAWYPFGTTKLAGGKSKLRIEVDAGRGADLAIDAILLTPGDYKPNGIAMPGG